jgi:hypothetical protein
MKIQKKYKIQRFQEREKMSSSSSSSSDVHSLIVKIDDAKVTHRGSRFFVRLCDASKLRAHCKFAGGRFTFVECVAAAQSSASLHSEFVEFWRQFLRAVEVECKLEHYHSRVLDRGAGGRSLGWQVEVRYDADQEQLSRQGGTLERGKSSNCMSCNLDVPLAVGLRRRSVEQFEADRDSAIFQVTSRVSLFDDDSSSQCRAWIDGKLRNMFVVTPRRHIERLAEANDGELFDFFALAAQLLRRQLDLERAPKRTPYIALIFNHGAAQNHAHLHLKVLINAEYFADAKSRWGDAHKQAWLHIEAMLVDVPSCRHRKQ